MKRLAFTIFLGTCSIISFAEQAYNWDYSSVNSITKFSSKTKETNESEISSLVNQYSEHHSFCLPEHSLFEKEIEYAEKNCTIIEKNDEQYDLKIKMTCEKNQLISLHFYKQQKGLYNGSISMKLDNNNMFLETKSNVIIKNLGQCNIK